MNMKEKGRKGLLMKTLQRCRSIGRKGEKTHQPPEGCFSVYVGPGRDRFVVRTECLNHPLFRTLLDEAETEYGYATDGPLELPCGVEFFLGVLSEMEEEEEKNVRGSPMCSFGKGSSGGYRHLSPARPAAVAAAKYYG